MNSFGQGGDLGLGIESFVREGQVLQQPIEVNRLGEGQVVQLPCHLSDLVVGHQLVQESPVLGQLELHRSNHRAGDLRVRDLREFAQGLLPLELAPELDVVPDYDLLEVLPICRLHVALEVRSVPAVLLIPHLLAHFLHFSLDRYRELAYQGRD